MATPQQNLASLQTELTAALPQGARLANAVVEGTAGVDQDVTVTATLRDGRVIRIAVDAALADDPVRRAAYVTLLANKIKARADYRPISG